MSSETLLFSASVNGCALLQTLSRHLGLKLVEKRRDAVVMEGAGICTVCCPSLDSASTNEHYSLLQLTIRRLISERDLAQVVVLAEEHNGSDEPHLIQITPDGVVGNHDITLRGPAGAALEAAHFAQKPCTVHLLQHSAAAPYPDFGLASKYLPLPSVHIDDLRGFRRTLKRDIQTYLNASILVYV
ncbi:hypothetical protein GMRT_11130 [Giardia muris]|uniref:Uncharacterized protein n=1 Tax=Giardia muris TaxID=5742 RepID=A0A4Z1T725_GIAMU|nr:hypothetical protein GMRT_11130 [Giardia muris]|eukprot:TNJ28927.1 hypothetical protein GMRT_11130 [Giardia muris]